MEPHAVVGHSSGEIAAAYAAGNMSLRDAMATAYYRGFVLGSSSRISLRSEPKGSMCAISTSAREIVEAHDGRVQLAAVNSPTSCTLSGDEDVINEIAANCATGGFFCRQLQVDMGMLRFAMNGFKAEYILAYHSHHMLPLMDSYMAELKSAEVAARSTCNRIQMYSSVTGNQLPGSDCSPEYWAQNMGSTVQFSTVVQEMFVHNPDVTAIIEIGPQPTLKAPIQEILRSLDRERTRYFNTCLRGEDDMRSLLSSVGGMIADGVPLAVDKINAQEYFQGDDWTYQSGEVLTDLPSYVWNHSTSFWSESRMSHNLQFRKFPRHQLLGSRHMEGIPSHPC